jgi:hypothetical protein
MSKPVVLIFDRDGGGKVILPFEEIGIISTLITNKGTEAEPDLIVEEGKCLVHVKALNSNIVVLHSADEIYKLWMPKEPS